MSQISVNVDITHVQDVHVELAKCVGHTVQFTVVMPKIE